MSTVLVVAVAATVMAATVGIAAFVIVKQRRSQASAAEQARLQQTARARATMRPIAAPIAVDAGVMINMEDDSLEV